MKPFFSRPGVELYHGDCFEVLPTLAAVDHVITDPPYEAEAHTLQRRVNRDMIADRDGGGRKVEVEALSFSPISDEHRGLAGSEIARLVRRWAVVFCQVEAAMKWSEALRPMNTRRVGVWVKPDGMPQFSGDRPGTGYESMVFAHHVGASRWNGGGRVGVFTHNKYDPDRNGHETQKPLPLMLELVELFTDPGETVLDPFAGSGTTGVACMRLGRKFIGIEKDEKYAEIAAQRFEAESQGMSLRDFKAGQMSLLDILGSESCDSCGLREGHPWSCVEATGV